MNYEQEWERVARAAVCSLPVLDSDELRLFDWHMRETESVIKKMTAEEREVVQKQLAQEREDAGDGWIAVDYFVRRIRYGQVIYLVSLVESFLTRACERLEVALGEENILFRLDELSGKKLTKRRKFLERYGRFSVSDIWTPIETMVSVRNFVIHENGNVSKSRSAPSGTGLAVVQGELVLDPSFVPACSSAVRELIDHVEAEFRKAADPT